MTAATEVGAREPQQARAAATLARMPPWAARTFRWAAFLVLLWVPLRPALTIVISGDDFINPFFVFEDYGPSPFGVFRTVSRDVFRDGHFNQLGANFGAVVFIAWAHLIGWGVRYSLIYAVTKFVVFVLVIVAAARLLRTLSRLTGREWSVWWSRIGVACVFVGTIQIHVAWSGDPVASFPLSGYLSAAIALVAIDLAVRALERSDRRSLAVASAMVAASILYYEINVVVIVVLVPLVVLLAVRSGWRPTLARAAWIVAVPVAMTLVLQRIAVASNEGYTGTDVSVGAGTGRVLVRATLGSLPASAWRAAHRWIGRPFDVAVADVISIGVITSCVLGLVLWCRWRPGTAAVGRAVAGGEATRAGARRIGLMELALVAAVPIGFWLGATVVQATTEKVRAETIGVGYVYNYYAYGSIGVALAVLLLVPPLRDALPAAIARWWPLALAGALSFVAVQVVVNGDVQRQFDRELAVSDHVLDAAADRPAEPARCDALARWAAMPFWLGYYRADFVSGVDALYRHVHGEPFCADLTSAAP